jgi:predicted ABC-type ATPase
MDTKVKHLIILAGANGTGKTTVAGELLKKYPRLEFLNADLIAVKTKGRITAGSARKDKNQSRSWRT